MSEKQKPKAKPVVYRKRHKSLDHLTANNTKHAFEQRLRGALQRQDSEPVFFGVSVMGAQENHSELEIFQTVTQHNYQEAAKQRTTRTRLKHQGHRHGRLRPDQRRSPEQFHQVDCSRRMHPRERTGADCLPEICIHAQESSKEIQRKGSPDARSTHSLPLESQVNPHIISDAKQSFPSFPTPYSISNPSTSLSFTFAGQTEVPILHPSGPSMAFMEDNGISGLGTGSINQSSDQLPSYPPPNDFQETCQGGQFYPHSNVHASTLPLYHLPTEAHNLNQQNFQFPFTLTNQCSFHLTDPNLQNDWFSSA